MRPNGMIARARSGERLTFRAIAVVFGATALLTAGCHMRETAAAATDRANDWTVPGVLRMASHVKPDNLNPVIGNWSIDTDLSMFWAGYLFNWSDTNKLVPELAVAEPTARNGGITADGLTITYHLRHGVQWQDGAPFTAADVVFTWRAVMNPRNDIADRTGYDIISSIRTPDAYTAVVRLRRPYAPFVATFLTSANGSYCVLPKHLLEHDPEINDVPYNRLPIGTGPFRIVSNDGTELRMVANPSYWRGAPALREVDYQVAPSDEDPLRALAHHQIDFVLQITNSLEPKLHDIAGTTTYFYPAHGLADIGFNLTSPAVSDRRIRQALAYAIDRRRILDTLNNGINQIADSDQPPASWAHASGLPRYDFDPGKARQLLDDAGWRPGGRGVLVKDGKPLRIALAFARDVADRQLAAREIVRDWRAIGVDVVPQPYERVKLFAAASQGGIEYSGKFDAILESFTTGTDPDDSSTFLCSMTPPAGQNPYHYCNPSVDADEAIALTSNDRAVRKAAYARIQRRLQEDLPVISLWWQQNQDVVNVDLRHYRPSVGNAPFWNTWQWRI